MFVLLNGKMLFDGKGVMKQDKKRGGFWIFYPEGVTRFTVPNYPFLGDIWLEVPEELIKEEYPEQYQTYLEHAFLFME